MVVALRSARQRPRDARQPVLPHAAHHTTARHVQADGDRGGCRRCGSVSAISGEWNEPCARVDTQGHVQSSTLLIVRILFFTHYFPPEVNAPANRTHEHCREWVKAGHEVHVITCIPSHPFGAPFPGYRRRWYQREEVDGIH